ncbi:MAG: hypothetical protein ACP5N1_00040 [Candidatus Woesearchaeota archaeon]
MSRKENTISASLLEKLIVNWATPFESMLILPLNLAGIDISRDFQEYFEKYGVIRGMWKSKIADYERLLNNDKSKIIPDKVIELYNGTPCGRVMIKTYNILRK